MATTNLLHHMYTSVTELLLKQYEMILITVTSKVTGHYRGPKQKLRAAG